MNDADERTADDRAVLEQARSRCLALLERLRRDASALDRPSRLATGAARAGGRAAYDRAAAAAAGLLARIEQSLEQAR